MAAQEERAVNQATQAWSTAELTAAAAAVDWHRRRLHAPVSYPNVRPEVHRRWQRPDVCSPDSREIGFKRRMTPPATRAGGSEGQGGREGRGD